MDNDTTLQKGKLKAKRKIKALDFSGANAAVALVSKDQGGPANAVPTLLIKGANFSDSFVEKASKIKVEMDIVEYLERFYNIYGENAEILARAMGFTTKRQEKYALEQQEEMLEDKEQMLDPERPDYDSDEKEWEDYVTSRVASLEIMKSLYEAESITDAIAALDEDEYLMFLEDQQMLEKAFAEVEKIKKESKQSKESKPTKANDASNEDNKAAVTAAKSDGEASASVNKQSNIQKQKGKKSMPTEDQQVEGTVEVITKAQFESLTKAFEEQQVELQKAKEALAAFEEEKKQAILKARKAQVLEAVKVEDKAEVIFKAVQGAADEDFEAVVKALKDLQASVDNSDLFIEKGASAHDDEVQAESPVAKILKAKLAKVK